jgi:hypothetical protein
MNHLKELSLCRISLTATALSLTLVLGIAVAQDTSTSSTQTGQPTVTTEVKSGTIVYASGNDVIVKLDDGTVKHVVVPDTTTIAVDGKDLTVHDLQPGMKVTRKITTSTTPVTVQTVRTVKGKVWYVSPPHTLILSFPDGTNKQYNVPNGAKFDIDGQKQSIFDVRKGMTISATSIKDEPQQEVASSRRVTGEAAPTPPETPPAVGVLLIEAPAPATPAATNEVAENTLPKTGSLIPLLGLLGLLSFATSLALRCLRS